MSAHVVPKAQAFASDEDEKTTIESGWEDEASTTIEQGEVAEKLRSFNGEPLRRNGTNITSTNGGALEEPTVDDRRANISVVTPVAAPARLVITHGNDTGQTLEVRPGKTYTIGRAIDNDVVLTDIAVSRKHFDLRHEAGAWVIVDRGSGNGTVVNGTVEDQPFQLAHADVIEIGNTTFRFDQPGGAPRASGYTMDLDEEEASTVAGKPLREEPAPLAPLAPAQTAPLPRRPRTVPPPAPLPRPRPPSVGPPPAYGFAPPAPLPSPASTLPMPQQLAPSRPMPAIGAHAPTMLGGDPMLRPQVGPQGMPPQGMLPTTIPGQGPPVAPAMPQPRALPFAYPNLADLPPQHAQLRANGTVPRDATSTALVQPAPYGTMAPPAYQTTLSTPQLSKRTKMIIGLASLTLVVTVATAAILKATAGDDARRPTPAAAPAKPTVESIPEAPKGTPATPTNAAQPTKPDAANGNANAGKADAAKTDAAKRAAAEDAAKRAAAEADAAKADAAKRAAAEDAAKRAAAEDAAKREAAARDAAKREAAARDAAKREEVARRDAAKREEAARRDAAKREAAAKAEAARREREEARRAQREAAARDNASEDRTVKRVAVADASGAKATADQLYRRKKFADAAATVRKAAAATSGAEASQLKTLAGAYEQVGRNYNVGMGPATKPTDALEALTRAQNVDRSAGGAFEGEIRDKLAQVAPKAAIAYAAAKQWEAAARAVRIAESLGAGNASTKAVREKLESEAGALYAQAMKQLDDDPDAAKAKLRQVKAMVDAKSPWAAKAQKALNGGG